ncbi:MAG: flippase-like domain-containing protein [Solirubrobacteraceae bacterium]|nr:flippase-like domain-containing protein [Solirubrobacteraceae bacterium]
MPRASILDGAGSFLDAVQSFFDSLAQVDLLTLAAGMAVFVAYLSMRAKALQNTLKAAYPDEQVPYRRIWGAYIAAYGFNNIVPARSGDVIKLFLVKTSVSRSRYPAIAATFAVEQIFDATMAVPVLLFAFTQGVFPKPPDFSQLDAFDLSWLAQDVQRTIFLLTATAILLLVAFALLSRRVVAFWRTVRQGFTILFDRRRYLREVWLVQFGGWLLRCAAFWLFLEAFGVGGSVRNVLLVLGVNAIAALVPFTPGGAGVQQALLLKVFAGAAGAATVAAYSVGQQIAIAAVSIMVGFTALATIFGFRSFKDVVRAGREHREAERNGDASPAMAPGEPPIARR